MRYCSVKNCVNNDVSGSEIFHNIRKEWIEQVIWNPKNPIFICSEQKCKKMDCVKSFQNWFSYKTNRLFIIKNYLFHVKFIYVK